MSIINVGMSWAWNGRVLGVVIFVPKVVPKKLAPMHFPPCSIEQELSLSLAYN